MNIFSIPILLCELQEIDNTSLVSYAYSLRDNNTGRTLSNKGGWQSDILNDSILDMLLIKILTNISYYANLLDVKKDKTISFTNTWLNINGQNDYNINHVHEGFISGVYYPQASPDMGGLRLENHNNLKSISWHGSNFNNYNTHNAENFLVRPKTGLLVLFPSWLEHGVEPNTINDDRISFSFNTRIENAVS